MKVTKTKSYNAPEGHFIATIYSITHTADPREELRITYKILSLKHPTLAYYVARTYRTADAEELQRDLYAIAGETYHALVDDDDNILNDRLDILLGAKVMVEVEHIHRQDHDKPFCKVKSVTRQDPSLN